MKHSQALTHVREMMIFLQKYRSNAAYEFDTDHNPAMQKVLASLQKWVFDDRYQLLPTLSRLTQAAEDGGTIEPMSFFNLMTIAHRLQPEIASIALLYQHPLPYPDPRWMLGWEAE